MKIYSLHERSYTEKTDSLGRVLDTLSGPDDRLWPREAWPPMLFDGKLSTGASGGHAFIRYTVEEYIPGRKAVFRFNGGGITADWDGIHYFEIVSRGESVFMRHVIDARGGFGAWFKWKAVIEPLHDALIEDALDRAEIAVNGSLPRPARWGTRVKIIRNLLAGKNTGNRAAAESSERIS